MNQWSEAERFHRAALEVQPDHVATHVSYGTMLARNVRINSFGIYLSTFWSFSERKFIKKIYVCFSKICNEIYRVVEHLKLSCGSNEH